MATKTRSREKPLKPHVESPTWGDVQQMAATCLDLLGGPAGAANKLNGRSFYTLALLASLNLDAEKSSMPLLGKRYIT